ncbi:MAG: hypothetical protein ACMUIG_01365 [Thermoplasmatota archaeon]
MKPRKEDSPSRMAVMGRYILDRDIFSWLKTADIGIGGELQLTDSLSHYIDTKGLYGLVIKGKRVDIGSTEDWLKANIEMALLDSELKDKLRIYFDKLRDDNRL